MGSFRIELPDLPSLSRKPSWTNKHGRVDRSACLEISASELWRRIPPSCWKETHIKNGNGPEGITAITIDAAFLYELHINRPARKLIGDFRTPKSNALKNPKDHQNRKNLKPFVSRWRAIDDYDDPPFDNPNKGEEQTKKLGLWSGDEPGYVGGWQQVVVLQRWQVHKKVSKNTTSSFPRHTRHSLAACAREGGWRESTPSRGRPPTTRHYLICPNCNEKKRKLFMVLATEQEIADAEIAEGWIRMIDAINQVSGIRNPSFPRNPPSFPRNPPSFPRNPPSFPRRRESSLSFPCRHVLAKAGKGIQSLSHKDASARGWVERHEFASSANQSLRPALPHPAISLWQMPEHQIRRSQKGTKGTRHGS